MKPTILFFVMFFSLESFGQDLITSQKKHFYYNDKWISKAEIKNVIQAQGDPLAIKYYSNWQTGNKISIGTIVLGNILVYIGYFTSEIDYSTGSPTELNGLDIAGIVLSGVGVVTLLVKKKSLRNAINRFNVVQQEVQLEFGCSNFGPGLRLKF